MNTGFGPVMVDKKKKGTIRFELRSEKADKDGKAPVRLIYQVKGQRKYYNTGQKMIPANWDKDKAQAIYIDRKTAKKLEPVPDYDLLLTDREVATINGELRDLQKMLESIEQRFELDRIIYSAEMVIERLRASLSPSTKKEAPSNQVYDFIDKYIDEHKTTRAEGSLSVYRALKKHLKGYQQYTGSVVTFEKIDYTFFLSFQNYLIDKAELNNTTISKRLSTLRTFLNYAKKSGIHVSDKYKDFKIKKEPMEVIALTNEELETLFNLDLSKNDRLSRVRDVFCFSCATALRYSDLKQLKWEHIKGDEIKISIKKTKKVIPLIIPLTTISYAVLAKYKGEHRPLPMMSSAKLNLYIKELCELAGMNEQIEIVRYRGAKREAITYSKFDLIVIHTGRKTFATLSLEKGMSAEETMAIGGWEDYQSFKRYVNITEQRKKIVMKQAWGDGLSNVKLRAIR